MVVNIDLVPGESPSGGMLDLEKVIEQEDLFEKEIRVNVLNGGMVEGYAKTTFIDAEEDDAGGGGGGQG